MSNPTGPKGPGTPELSAALQQLKAEQISSLTRLVTRPTNDARFGQIFAENPAAALAAKGILVSEAEAANIRQRIGAVRGNAAETEVEVSVKVKF